LRIIEVVCEPGHADTVFGISEHEHVFDAWYGSSRDTERVSIRLLAEPADVQPVLDGLQQQLGGSTTARIVVLPVEATLPRVENHEPPGEGAARHHQQASREELYQDVEGGARLDRRYLTLVVLSTVVAAIGLVEDNVEVVIGAMVIAPLLGPNLALALGTALGDADLVLRALRTGLAGLAVAIGLAGAIGFLWPQPLVSRALDARIDVGWDSIALALAAGAAGVLSLTTGLPSVLVGVMVAVALLPPAAALGLMFGAGDFHAAGGAGLLLAVNVVCVNLAAKLVFLIQGVRPRTWLEQRKARQSMRPYLSIWVASLAVLVAIVYLRQTLALPASTG
jgi:uncharacterized hydrophobic protein (TIGR00341 family)